jgi:hypothetical protein
LSLFTELYISQPKKLTKKQQLSGLIAKVTFARITHINTKNNRVRSKSTKKSGVGIKGVFLPS